MTLFAMRTAGIFAIAVIVYVLVLSRTGKDEPRVCAWNDSTPCAQTNHILKGVTS